MKKVTVFVFMIILLLLSNLSAFADPHAEPDAQCTFQLYVFVEYPVFSYQKYWSCHNSCLSNQFEKNIVRINECTN